MPSVYSVTANVQHGNCTPASPDGRYAREPLSDCLGPVHTQCCSHDHSGPTAIANSVAKIDQSRIANGVILNWKFSPAAVSGDVDTMVCAQKKPENYKDLLVRIAG